MDAGKYYALLRFEEAALALRAAMRLGIVEEMGERKLMLAELRELFGFTGQGARTYVALLEVLEILESSRGVYSVSPRAKETLADDLPTSRKPYLQMGSGDDVDQLIEMLRGNFAKDSLPLYGDDAVEKTLMDVPDVAREIAIGLSSRARNFAEPLAAAISQHAGKARILADLGAGSPYVGLACLETMPHLKKVTLVDRPNGMQFVRELADKAIPNNEDVANLAQLDKLDYCEQDFFQSVPGADIYCLSNTAHDWLPDEYTQIITNLRDSIAQGGVVCIHEPLLLNMWNNSDQWIKALWMACYALALFKLTEGKGTCYTRDEHRGVMESCGFAMIGEGIETQDGCTALFFQLASDAAKRARETEQHHELQSAAQKKSAPKTRTS